MKIKLSQYTPRKLGGTIIIPKVIILTRKLNIENLTKTYLNIDALHVMKEDTLQEIVLETKIKLTRGREKRKDIMLMVQRMMNLSQRIKQKSDDSSSHEEYVLISALTGTITHGSNDWLIDSGASKHMMGFKESFVKLSEHESPHKVKLGDDYQYPIKGSGESSYTLDFGKSMKMKDVLFVPGLKKNLLSISALDYR